MKTPIFEDKELESYRSVIEERHRKMLMKLSQLTKDNETLSDIANGYLYYGLHKYPDKWVLREWAPHAKELYLIGDFNHWQKNELYAFKRVANGDWVLELPIDILQHEMLYKLWVVWDDGAGERIPAYCRRVVQDDVSKIFSAQVWDPKYSHIWKHEAPKRQDAPLIYEAHIGMASEEAGVSTYIHFKDNVLPYIADMGYNTVQLMAIQEHPYYGSFGYQVSNFFATLPKRLMRQLDS